MRGELVTEGHRGAPQRGQGAGAARGPQGWSARGCARAGPPRTWSYFQVQGTSRRVSEVEDPTWRCSHTHARPQASLALSQSPQPESHPNQCCLGSGLFRPQPHPWDGTCCVWAPICHLHPGRGSPSGGLSWTPLPWSQQAEGRAQQGPAGTQRPVQEKLRVSGWAAGRIGWGTSEGPCRASVQLRGPGLCRKGG